MLKTFADITVRFNGTTLTGYMMEDGSCQFYMRGKFRFFPRVMDACQWWLENGCVTA